MSLLMVAVLVAAAVYPHAAYKRLALDALDARQVWRASLWSALYATRRSGEALFIRGRAHAIRFRYRRAGRSFAAAYKRLRGDEAAIAAERALASYARAADGHRAAFWLAVAHAYDNGVLGRITRPEYSVLHDCSAWKATVGLVIEQATLRPARVVERSAVQLDGA